LPVAENTESTPSDAVQVAPAIVLVKPQLAQNVGAVARAMLNCGLEDLRLVAPRHGWPNPAAYPSASGADEILDAARVYETTREAVNELAIVYACTARLRDMVKPVVAPREAAAELRLALQGGARAGLLFGAERNGLSNDDVVLCRKVLHVPLNPSFRSLNLAQAVLLFAYEWRMSEDPRPARREPRSALEEPASQAELRNFFEHLEEELERAGFFAIPEKKPAMVRNIRNIFSRAGLTYQEARTLHGIVRRLSGRPKGGIKSPRG